jgi:hypothetical protein
VERLSRTPQVKPELVQRMRAATAQLAGAPVHFRPRALVAGASAVAAVFAALFFWTRRRFRTVESA